MQTKFESLNYGVLLKFEFQTACNRCFSYKSFRKDQSTYYCGGLREYLIQCQVHCVVRFLSLFSTYMYSTKNCKNSREFGNDASIHVWMDKMRFYCNVCETLIRKLVYLFNVFGKHGRYIVNIGNINHLW